MPYLTNECGFPTHVRPSDYLEPTFTSHLFHLFISERMGGIRICTEWDKPTFISLN